MTTDKKVDKGGLFNSDMRMKIEIFFIFMLVTDLLFIPLLKALAFILASKNRQN